MDDVSFVDTTFRDGSQSLWAMGIRHKMMEAIAADLDRAQMAVIEVPANAIFFKKFVRDLKEDPWEIMRMLAREIPNTPKACMAGGFNLNSFGAATPPVLGELYWQIIADIGALQRLQMVANTADQLTRQFPSAIPKLRALGYTVAIGISYSISPRHTDEYFIEKARHSLEFAPDAIYIKDQGGLLTVDAIRALVPPLLALAGDTPVELHSHCTTGLAPSVYAEAVRLGIRVLHCGVPPLSDGSAQPSILDTARNVRQLGLNAVADEELLASVSQRLHTIAVRAGMPLGEPLRFDEAQYEHQIPGGVISNLKFQLAEINLTHRFDEVLAEAVRVREDLGYPIMITPYSQYVATQAAINVATGERYKVVIDELIRFAQGVFGEDSGYTWMDQNLKDRFLSLPRAAELGTGGAAVNEMSLKDAKALYGTPDTSDEEIILRAIMQGTAEIETMRKAGPPEDAATSQTPLLTLMKRVGASTSLRYVHIDSGSDSMVLQRAAAPTGSTASTASTVPTVPTVAGKVVTS